MKLLVTVKSDAPGTYPLFAAKIPKPGPFEMEVKLLLLTTTVNGPVNWIG